MTFAERLRSLRGGMTLTALARLSGISRSYLYQLESGESHPTLECIEKLSDAFEMTVVEFLEPLYTRDEPAFPLAV